MKAFCRGHRTFIVKTPGLSRQKSPAQTIMILLLESGLIFFGIQVNYFGVVLLRVLTFLTDSVLVLQCVWPPYGCC